jgi:hypothetical protein
LFLGTSITVVGLGWLAEVGLSALRDGVLDANAT